MSLWRRILVTIAQTVVGLIGGIGCAMVAIAGSASLTPRPDTSNYLCHFCPDGGWLPPLIAAPLGVTGAVWLIGRVVGQGGNFWLTLLGTLIGFGVTITGEMWQRWLPLPIVLDILIPVLFCPLLAALLYQLSARDKTTQEVIEVTHE